MTVKTQVEIYTKDAGLGNPGGGGWGAVLMHGETRKEIFSGAADTTNNRMELMAVIKALSSLKRLCGAILPADQLANPGVAAL